MNIPMGGGKLYIDNFKLMERNMIGSPTDGYEERPKLPEEGGCGSSIALGTAGIFASVTAVAGAAVGVARKRKK